ncbi:hypothetical protein EDD18DRAFT_1191635, partial [Armillaria luteobubalina]
MMHFGCSIRRLLSTACHPQRTVRIDKLPDGYKIDTVIAALKASPVESIIPEKNHLLVRFFDESTARRYASRTLFITNPPREKRVLLKKMDGLQWTRIENERLEYRFLDVTDACRVFFHRYNTVTGAKFVFVPDDKDEYMFPSWYPRKEFLVGKWNGTSGVQYQRQRMLDKLVAEFDSRRKTKSMKVVLATSERAKQFLEACQDAGIAPGDQILNDVSLSVPPERRSSMHAYRRFFAQYGSLRPEASEDDAPDAVHLHYESILGAMKAVMLTEATFEGASITFLGSPGLEPHNWRYP